MDFRKHDRPFIPGKRVERAMKKILLSALLLVSVAAHAQLVENPLLIPSTSLQTGNCVQATGPNSVATIAGPCGSGSGAGNVTGPSSSTTNDIAAFSNGTGTGILDTGVQYSNVGLLGSSQAWNGLNTFNALISVNGAAGTLRGVEYKTAGVMRWAEGADVAPETGSNSGSDWVLQGYGDNGATGVTSMDVSRVTGAVYFGVRPAFGVNTPWDSGNFNPTLYATLAGPTAFATRPTFNGATPWDSLNFNPAGYLSLSGGGWVTGPLTNGASGVSANASINIRDNADTNNIAAFPVLASGSYNPIVVSGDAALIAGATYNNGAGIDIAPWSTVASGGIRVAASGVTINGATAFNTTPTAPTQNAGTSNTTLATTAFVQGAVGTGGGSPTYGTVTINTALNDLGTSSFAGAATFTGPIYSNFSFVSTTGTGDTQGVIDSGQLIVGGNSTLGNSGATVTTVNGTLEVNAPVVLHGYTVEALPVGSAGATAYVTDAEVCGFNAYVSGGGSLFCPVIFNGSGWVGG
jgi:hypothetical protein